MNALARLKIDPYEPTIEAGWDGQGVRLVCVAPQCRREDLSLDIDLPVGVTIAEAFEVAMEHVEQFHARG